MNNLAYRLYATVIAFGLIVFPSTIMAKADPLTVIELFTSQGCSSCPPADEYLAELSEDPSVLALTLPVDYWDYLGWRDTNGRKEHTQRQYLYAKTLKKRSVYTPQIVVNGVADAVGSDRRNVRNLINTVAPFSVPVSVHQNANTYIASIGAGDVPEGTMVAVWLVFFDKKSRVNIPRGENSGKKIAYHNVVRSMRMISVWEGKALKLTIAKSDVMRAGTDSCAIIVQSEKDGRLGPIVGAALLI